MEIIRGLHNFKKHHHGCVLTIGNFDGVHLGHQAIIRQVCEQAKQLSLPAVVMTFEPQAMEFFRPQEAPSRLTRFREKIDALQVLGIDRVCCINFNDQFARLSAQQFIEETLVTGLGVRYLVVGDDFRFGKERVGDFELLRSVGQQLGEQKGFEVVNTHSVTLDDERVSSTRVRLALANGELLLAQQLLGNSFQMCGRVAHGDKRGRTIGFPTANVYLHRKVSPIKGVFAVQMEDAESNLHNGVANIGNRPTVDGTKTLLEVHLFDFDKDIYGQHVKVKFIKKIRDEQKFDSFEQLKQQIQKDSQQARASFS